MCGYYCAYNVAGELYLLIVDNGLIIFAISVHKQTNFFVILRPKNISI